jgi:hypothetical protein
MSQASNPITDLWRWDGTVGRGTYALVGFIGFAPLNELSPYKQIHAPHLHGYFISHGGQFLLTGLPGGRTRLEGTTWYRHTMWPATYWGWWSDYVIHRIHMRVLNHIREQAEMRSVQAFATAADSSTR